MYTDFRNFSCTATQENAKVLPCGCSAGVEQSATTDQARLLATDISAGDQVSCLIFSTSHLADGSLALSLMIDSKTVSTRSATLYVLFLLSAPQLLPSDDVT